MTSRLMTSLMEHFAFHFFVFQVIVELLQVLLDPPQPLVVRLKRWKVNRVFRIFLFSNFHFTLGSAMSKLVTMFVECFTRWQLDVTNVANDFVEVGRFQQMSLTKFVLIPKTSRCERFGTWFAIVIVGPTAADRVKGVVIVARHDAVKNDENFDATTVDCRNSPSRQINLKLQCCQKA